MSFSIDTIRSKPTKDHETKLFRSYLWSILRNWEFYVLLLIAGWLRLYHLGSSEFNTDQAALFRMAYDAVHQGLLPVTSNEASIGFANAPGSIYLLMPATLFTSNPIAGTLLTGSLATLSVAITYIFVHKYYGRMAAIFATFLYAVAPLPLNYSRTLWQPNMMYLFTMLFIFALFRGVVERRKGWFFPACLLLSILYQMHPTTIILGSVLCLAVLLAPTTIRWRDMFYACLGVGIVFFPYLLWQLLTGFHELPLMVMQSRAALIDKQAIFFEGLLLGPYSIRSRPSYPQSFGKLFYPYLQPFEYLILALALVTIIVLSGTVLWRWYQQIRDRRKAEETRQRFWQSWESFMPRPAVAGLAILCAWQILPVLILTRHSAPIFPQYLFMTVPAPFILIGLLPGTLGSWDNARWQRIAKPLLRALYVVLAFLVLAQLMGSVANIRDKTQGYFRDHGSQESASYYEALDSSLAVLEKAEALADQYHARRILIATDRSTELSMYYLGEHTRYPTTVYRADTCLLMPRKEDGPAILIMAPYARTGKALALLNAAKLLGESARLGGSPYLLYALPSASTNEETSSGPVFAPQLQAAPSVVWQDGSESPLVTRWTVRQPYEPGSGKRYVYEMHAQISDTVASLNSSCTLSNAQAGDQLIVSFQLSPTNHVTRPQKVAFQARTYTMEPYNPTYGPFHLATHRLVSSSPASMLAPDGSTLLTLPIS
ncbi:glycosyltransferase family 39 protein [Ktedonospora formicarum]|uniref:glycosyltransferase family 39 protein n=1 Tax=Ktedonospora formicarum TaxID=2778364 RepID=UPI001C6921EE|nr:glycosyltransferase family 39 protein [Ktedonospora formicarum]